MVLEQVVAISQYSVDEHSAACAAISCSLCVTMLYAPSNQLFEVDYASGTIHPNLSNLNQVIQKGTEVWRRMLPQQQFSHRFLRPTEVLNRCFVPARYIPSFDEYFGIVGRPSGNVRDAGLRPLCDVLRELIGRNVPIVVAVLSVFNATYSLRITQESGGGRSCALIDSHPKKGTTVFATNVPMQFLRLVLWRIGVPVAEWEQEIMATPVDQAEGGNHLGLPDYDPSKRGRIAPDSAATSIDQYELCVLHAAPSIVFTQQA